MIERSVRELQDLRQKTDSKIHIIDSIDGKLYDFEPIFPDEETAKEKITEDIKHLITSTYDYFPGYVSLSQGMIVCAFYHVRNKDLIGTIALYHYNLKHVDYIELGLSLIALKYRKMGFQSVEIRRIREFAFFFLLKGNPFYASARMESATTQLQISRSKLPNFHGQLVTPVQPRGFLPQYIANRDSEGNFILEFGLFYEAWPTLDEQIHKEIFLPLSAKSLNFSLLDSAIRKDIHPRFLPINFLSEDQISINKKMHSWDSLKDTVKIFGNLKTEKDVFYSSNKKFTFSNYSAPDKGNLAICIEKIDDIRFISDFLPRMKSINITLQISDFQDIFSCHATVFIIHQLITNGFVPCSIHDLKYKDQRVRVLLLAKWQGIKMQDYFQFLPEYKTIFENFWQDCIIQGLEWSPIPKKEIMTAEKIQEHILVERFKSIF